MDQAVEKRNRDKNGYLLPVSLPMTQEQADRALEAQRLRKEAEDEEIVANTDKRKKKEEGEYNDEEQNNDQEDENEKRNLLVKRKRSRTAQIL